MRKVALVIGGAKCVWDDVALFRKLWTPDVHVCVNHIGMIWPHTLHCWVSYHADLLVMWIRERARNGFNDANELWTSYERRDARPPIKCWPVEGIGGSSGLLATYVAKGKGLKVVLAGVPMSADMGHWHDKQQNKPWAEALKFQSHWTKRLPELKDDVRSMSGWTRDLLGEPDAAWLRR